MVTAVSKDNSRKIVVYESAIVAFDKEDDLIFDIETNELKYKIIIQFDSEGKSCTSTCFEDIEYSTIRYVLHNWDSPTWVEVSQPVRINVLNSKELFFMKFRNSSPNEGNCRLFNLTIWKTI